MKNPLTSIKERSARKSEKSKTHRLPANVTGEEDWEVDVPQIRMSRAFGVMLALHLVAVGGLFAFHMFGKDDHEQERAETERANQTAVTPEPARVREPATVPANSPATRRTEELVAPHAEVLGENGQTEHTIRSGESQNLIAARYDITVSELEAANPGTDFAPGTTLVIPSRQHVISGLPEERLAADSDTDPLPATTNGIPHRTFAVKDDVAERAAPVADVLSRPLAPAPDRQDGNRQLAVSDANRDHTVDISPPPAPSRVKTPPAPAPAEPEKPRPAGTRSHVVQKGDTVYNVARRYSLSPSDVMKANGLTDAKIKLGQVLKIPVRR